MMKKIIIYPVVAVFLIAASIFTFLSCEDMFTDPLVDKETGDEMTMLIVDMNFIKTKIAIYLEDIDTGETIEGDEIEIFLGGDNVTNIIDFAGEKPSEIKTSSGFIELGYDPNFDVTKDTPLELTLTAVGENYISLPDFYSYTTEGVKNIIVKLIFIGTQPKAGGTGFDEPFDIGLNGSHDLINFVRDVRLEPHGSGFSRFNVYLILGAGTFLCDNLTNVNNQYSDFGVQWFHIQDQNRGNSQDIPPVLDETFEAIRLDVVATAVELSNQLECDEGLTFIIDGPAGGSGTFDYLLAFSDGTQKSGSITAPSFPHTALIEQIFYTNSNVNISLSGDAQYNMLNSNGNALPIYAATPCGETVTFTATPISNLTTYRMITQYFCSNEPSVGLALSIGGQFRKADEEGDWTGFSFTEGICEIQIVENADYDFRVSIDGEWREYTLPTDPDAIQAFLDDNESQDFTVRTLVITESPDLITINAVVELDESICNLI